MIVDDHPVLRHGLAALLETEPWVGHIVGASTVAEATELVVIERPQLAVVDLGLPDGDGVELIRRLRRSVPECAVLVLTMTSEESAVRASLDAGASGYVLKSSPPLTIVRAVQTVADGGLVLGPGVTPSGLDGQNEAKLPPPLDRLAPHDVRLLALVAEGRSNPEIARVLGLSEKTVRNRLSVILIKLGVADRVQAALLARDKGLIAAPPWN
jgi:two-component system, NarL family, nitrate/nitrite response regulator NarL